MSALKDYGARHPDWVMADEPMPYNTHDPEFDLKLARALKYLQDSQMWRGETQCRHQYIDSYGVVTKHAHQDRVKK